MSAGLFGLLDDVAALARLAAASIDDVGAAAGRATTKAAGVVIDDTAVTPQYVRGIAAERELPIVKQIALGSIRNKLLLILPAALLLSQFLPWLLTPILMLGGAYLSYEAVHKIHGAWTRSRAHRRDTADTKALKTAEAAETVAAPDEDKVVAAAVRTDLILSAEIMVIALNEVAEESFWSRLTILAVVAVAITIAVYGVVALIVRIDDVGLRLASTGAGPTANLGRKMVSSMPTVLTAISIVGTAAMLWVGGHIELVGMHDLGFSVIYDAVHDVEHWLSHHVAGVGAILAWLTNTLASALIGLLVGSPIAAVMHQIHRRRH